MLRCHVYHFTHAPRWPSTDGIHRAYPYSLSPAGCGHTYCAICILKWYFSNMCNDCVGWCYPLDCPLCRAVLPGSERPDERPRPMFALPFTPARAADERITNLIDSLCGPVPESPSKASSSKRSKGKGKKKQASSDAGPSTGWEYGGALRAEWQERDRCVANYCLVRRSCGYALQCLLSSLSTPGSRGRTEMRNLVNNWSQMSRAALIELKTRMCASP